MAEQAKAPTKHLSGDAAIQKVRQLLGNFRSVMLMTKDGDELNTRPMGLTGKPEDFNGTLWFFTDDRSKKLQQLTSNVSLIMQSDADSAFVHLRGQATVSLDKAIMKQLYTPFLKTWFPSGLDDPHMVLLRFDAESGEFWESPGGMIQVFAAFAKSVITGEPGKGGSAGDLKL